MKEIPLTLGKVAIVDDGDFKKTNQHKWYAHKEGNTFYARRTRFPNNFFGMHREILGLDQENKQWADHINGDGLDNRKSNLRICDRSQNQMNRKKNKFRNFINCTSIYKGVRLNKGKWQARIGADGKQIYLGMFKNEKSAAMAYNEAAIKLHKQ